MSLRFDTPRRSVVIDGDSLISLGLLTLFFSVIFAITALAFMGDPATVGGTAVPGDLACQEDEVITFTDVDTLGCLHYQEVRP